MQRDRLCAPLGVREILCQICLVILTLTGGTSEARGQVLYGSIVGHVKDPSGAAIPGAEVPIV